MKIKSRSAQFTLDVRSKQGNEILSLAARDYRFDGDLDALVKEFGRIQAELEETERTAIDPTN